MLLQCIGHLCMQSEGSSYKVTIFKNSEKSIGLHPLQSGIRNERVKGRNFRLGGREIPGPPPPLCETLYWIVKISILRNQILSEIALIETCYCNSRFLSQGIVLTVSANPPFPYIYLFFFLNLHLWSKNYSHEARYLGWPHHITTFLLYEHLLP